MGYKDFPIIFIADMDKRGSGYANIVVQLCNGLYDMGYDVFCLGLGYDGSEHGNKFKLIPVKTLQDVQPCLTSIKGQTNAGVCVTAMDIPMQGMFIPMVKNLGMKSVVITPLESRPLCLSWAMILSAADKQFFISQMGTDEALAQGLLGAEHLQIGIDTVSWRLRTQDEYEQGRKALGITSDTFVVLTVADNQERKNLSKSFEIVSKFKKEKHLKVRYILVTRENSKIGWPLRDMAMEFGIASDLMIFERGISFKQLYSLYAIADCFLLTSKREGLGMPILEAMAVGVPVIASNTGAITELLSDGRGTLLKTDYPTPNTRFIDPWGMGDIVIPNADDAVNDMETWYRLDSKTKQTSIVPARKYVESRTWDIPVNQMVKTLEALDEKE